MAVDADLYPSIARDRAVQGGAAVVRGTRVPVRAIAFYWRAGADDERILSTFPRLTRETLAEAIRYYEAHRDEIDEELRAESSV